MNIVKINTPWEIHEVLGRKVYVKREDLCCPFPGPSFSKLRGVEAKIKELQEQLLIPEYIGVLDSIHSKAGWGVSYICKKLGIPCEVFYPVKKSEDPKKLRYPQRRAQAFGAKLRPLPATMSSVLFYQALKLFRQDHPEGFFFPNGLRLPQTIEETAKEVNRVKTFEGMNLIQGSWIVSVSSGTIAAGVAAGLDLNFFPGILYLHLGYSRSNEKMKSYINKYSVIKTKVIDEKYEYKDLVKYDCPFPCNPYYDLKAWKWLTENIKKLKEPIIFWNIGS